MNQEVSGNKIVSGMFWQFSERITAQMVSFVVSIILARILLPQDYGVIAIVNVFIIIAEVFVTNGFGTALIQKKKVTESEFSTVFWCNLMMALVLYIIVFLVAPLIAEFYDMAVLSPILRVLAIRLPINAFNSIQNAYISRNMDFKKFFFATIIGTIISAIVGIVMAYRGAGAWALVVQMLTNTVIDTIILFIIIEWKPTFEFSLKEAKPLLSYGWKILATDLLGTIFNQLNSFIIGKKYSSSDLAYYSQGKKIPDLINNNVASTLCTVLFPAMSLSDGKEEIKKIRRKSLQMIEYVLFPMMFGIIVVADKMILVLMTEKWIFAVPYVRITCVAAIIGVLGTTLIQEVKAIGRSDVTLKLEVLKKCIFLVIAILAMQFGVMAIAYTLIINQCIAFCFNVYPVKKYIGFDFKIHLMDTLPPIVMSCVMSVIVFIIGKVINNTLVCLGVQILMGGIIYIALSIFTKNESFIYLKNMALSMLNKYK